MRKLEKLERSINESSKIPEGMSQGSLAAAEGETHPHRRNCMAFSRRGVRGGLHTDIISTQIGSQDIWHGIPFGRCNPWFCQGERTEGDTLPLFGVIAQGHQSETGANGEVEQPLPRLPPTNVIHISKNLQRRTPMSTCQPGTLEGKVTNRRTLDGFRRVRMRKIQGSEGSLKCLLVRDPAQWTPVKKGSAVP